MTASLDAANTLGRKVISAKARPSPLRGRMVTIGAAAALKGRSCPSIYCDGQAGMTPYTRGLADQLCPYDIAVNRIAPGDQCWPGQ